MTTGKYTVTVLHRRVGYSENVKFISYYTVKSDACELELIEMFAKAFLKAHPKRKVLEVDAFENH